MTSDKTKYFIALALIEGLKQDLQNRVIKCKDCEWTLHYVNYAINTLEELDNEN